MKFFLQKKLTQRTWEGISRLKGEDLGLERIEKMDLEMRSKKGVWGLYMKPQQARIYMYWREVRGSIQIKQNQPVATKTNLSNMKNIQM